VRPRALQLFFTLASLFLASSVFPAELLPGQIYPLRFSDVDENSLSTADGHVTVLVLTTQSNIDKAREVGDRVPDYCLGNQTYRMITVVNFQKKRRKLMRAILSALVRRHLDAEARRLQIRYDEKNIPRNARRDIFAVADFDGAATAQLGLPFESADFRVFVFARNSELLQRWDDVPTAEALAAVVK